MAIYWKQKHEQWCADWLSASTKQQYIIYKNLHGVLQTMCEIISHRYFSVPFAVEKQYYREAINEVFLKLQQFNPQRAKAYSFCSMVIKNFYYNKFVSGNTKKVLDLEFVDDYEPVDHGKSLYVDNEVLDTEGLLRHLEALENRINTKIRREFDGQRTLTLMKAENLLQILSLCKEYVRKFDDFSAISVAEYCQNNTVHGAATIGLYFKELFGVYVNAGGRQSKIKEPREYREPQPKEPQPKEPRVELTPEQKIERRRGYMKKYRDTHKEQIKAYREGHREADRKSKLKWYYKNKEAHRLKAIENTKRWAEKNPDKKRKYNTEWQRKNREKIREYNRIRYLNKKDSIYGHNGDIRTNRNSSTGN